MLTLGVGFRLPSRTVLITYSRSFSLYDSDVRQDFLNLLLGSAFIINNANYIRHMPPTCARPPKSELSLFSIRDNENT